jgi:hypothetical protein
MKIKSILSALLVAVAFLSISNDAKASGLQFGVKAGLTVNSLKFNNSVFDADNRCGYTAGLMTKFIAPVLNIGFDASVMYTHRSINVGMSADDEGLYVAGENISRNYIEIPINFRWDISLPVIGSYVTPFLTTGPDLSFLVSKENAENAWNNKTFDFAWNFGVGLMFVNKIQVHASYGIGLNNAASADSSLYGKFGTDSKNRFWTITAAYLF